MNGNPLITIAVPVYNTELFVRRCLDSLVNQTIKEIEIVVVNDGSTDQSEAICKEFAEKDSRITLICKENEGLASARQTALEVSKGKYFCVCDSDDWVEKNMYEQLYLKAEETDADVVMCDYWSEYQDGKQIIYHYPLKLEERKDLLDDALNQRFPTMVWNKMFRRDLFERYQLSWEYGINMGEDLLLMLKLLCNPVKIACLTVPLYHYRRLLGGNSYTNCISLSTFNQLLFIRKWSITNIDNIKYQNGLFIQWLDQAFAGFRVKNGMTSQYYKESTLKNISYSGFLNFSYPQLKGLIVLIAKIFGFKTGKSIVKIMYRYIYH